MWGWLIAQAGDSAANPWWQYGALGAVAFIGIGFMGMAYRDQRDRADRAEKALADLNTVVRDNTVAAVTRATEAVTWALERKRRGE